MRRMSVPAPKKKSARKTTTKKKVVRKPITLAQAKKEMAEAAKALEGKKLHPTWKRGGREWNRILGKI